MATDLENLQTRRSAILAELASLTSSRNGGRPTYSIDGQMIDHVGYRKSLLEELKSLNEMLSAIQGPFESVDQATT